LKSESASEDYEQKKKNYYISNTPTRRLATVLCRQALHLLTINHLDDAENIPSSGGVIVAANHITNFDVFLLQLSISRPLFYMGKAELFQNPILDWLLRQFGSFPVRRGEKDAWALQHAKYLLTEGKVLGMFPEGTRSKGKGLRIAKTGTVRLALAVNCPVVPVAIYGTQNMFKNFPHRTQIDISIGEPIFLDSSQSLYALTNLLMYKIAEMLPPEIRGVYS